MGTSGCITYLYKGRYYATSIGDDAFPGSLGNRFTAKIPQDPTEREAWIHITFQTKKSSGTTLQAMSSETAGLMGFSKDDRYLSSAYWTYVADLGSRAFTINGLTHFRLDNMPPEGINRYFRRISAGPGRARVLDLGHASLMPKEHIATVSRWPVPGFDASLAHDQYLKLAPVITRTHELDAAEYIEYKTVQMIQNLRKYGRTRGTGIFFFGRHILAVRTDGDTNGFLLATRLLSPVLVDDKTQPLASALPNIITATAR
ncbi:hypothetical protein FRC09_008677, partial [Ceratobasidium sp. 395]